MRNEVNQQKYDNQRKRYMNQKITHEEFYLWLAKFIGITEQDLPVNRERIMRSQDPHLNDIPLKLWDDKDPLIRRRAYDKGIAWSLCDTVCALKALAKQSIK